MSNIPSPLPQVLKCSALLRNTHTKIEETGHSKHAFARNANGDEVKVLDPSAEQFTILGYLVWQIEHYPAIDRVITRHRLLRYLGLALEYTGLTWNDLTHIENELETVSDVLRLLDKAIVKAEEDGQ